MGIFHRGIAYVDPGNLEADLQIGAQFGILSDNEA